MKPLKTIFDLLSGKRTILKENMGTSCTLMLNRVNNLKWRKSKTFFHQSIVLCMVDAFEYFLKVDFEHNVFYKKTSSMTTQASQKFIRWETAFNTLMFTGELVYPEEITRLENDLFYVFEATDKEKAKYFEYKDLLIKNRSAFAVGFSKDAACDIFSINEIDSIAACFIYNFYNSCYTEFYRTFAKYTVVNDKNSKDCEIICLNSLQTSK